MSRPVHPVLALAVVALAAAFAGPAQAEPQAYRLDPVHTRVMFAISHAGFSDALGTVSGSTGTLWFDPDDWRSARLDVSVPVSRLDLGDAKWNAASLAPNLLDGQRHPDARFVSDAIEPLAPDRARVCGQLTLRGTTAPLCLEVTLNALKRHPLPPFRRTAGFSATATLSRAAFGITAWKRVIGDDVELRIEAEAVRDARAGDSVPAVAAGAPPDPAPADDTPTPQVEAVEAGDPSPTPEPTPQPDPEPAP